MHPLFLLALGTFVLFAGFLVWNLRSTQRQKGNPPSSGIGGPNDPLAGNTEGIRHPDEIRADLDNAHSR